LDFEAWSFSGVWRLVFGVSRAVHRAWLLTLLWCLLLASASFSAEAATSGPAAPVATSTNTYAVPSQNPNRYNVQAYEVRGVPLFWTNSASLFASFTGTNVGVAEIVQAAARLQLECLNRSGATVSVTIAQERITNGLVTLNAFRGHVPEILISGKRYSAAAIQALPGQAAATQTNAGPHFVVRAYEISGDTLLTTNTLTSILLKYTGTNIGIDQISKAASELQMEYRDRGFPTVSVTIPQQEIKDGIVKFRVFQGRLADISVIGNRYFTSNNVMRALPSLHTNIILNQAVFQAELDRANANQDRQIYPQIEPGAEPNTSDLVLKVQDRLPLHAKLDFNNQSSPGTPELRLNSSAVYNNLWQLEHSLGVQYSFSPEEMKDGEQWSWYDRPVVANYSAFYRLPLANPSSLEQTVETQPGTFGFSEATRKFNLPPPTGRPEMNFYASGSTIDTRLETLSNRVITEVPGVLSISERDVQQDITDTGDLGWRLNLPLTASANFQSGFSSGLDFKTYQLQSFKTNIFLFSIITVNPDGSTNPPVTSEVNSPVPTTYRYIGYLPLSIRYDASLHDPMGLTTFGLGLSGNAFYTGSTSNLHNISGSTQSSGHWVVLNPTLSRDLTVYTNWTFTARASGQWASEPLISNEQFGVGGVNTVRGYREGEVFGDTGWVLSLEQKTPSWLVGMAFGHVPLMVRGSIYMDYGQSFLLDPQGRPSPTSLWGTGFGGVATLGSHFEARLLFSWPLLRTMLTEPGQPRFDFGLSAQF
jgi:hemolysin activation/secretion protein